MTRMYESRDFILIRTAYADPAQHSHSAAQIILSPESPLEIRTGDRIFSGRGFLIPSGVPHKIRTFGSPCLVFLFDSTTGAASRIRELRTLPELHCAAIADGYDRFARTEDCQDFRIFAEQTLDLLGLKDAVCPVTDTRILSAMTYIRSHLRDRITCRDAADSVFLSQSRFSHLFRQQTGMTFSAYLIFQRLMAVYRAILKGCSITEGALDAGFSSSAHFADVNRRVFGLSASAVTGEVLFRKIL